MKLNVLFHVKKYKNKVILQCVLYGLYVFVLFDFIYNQYLVGTKLSFVVYNIHLSEYAIFVKINEILTSSN